MSIITDIIIATLLWWGGLLLIYFSFGTFAEYVTSNFPNRKIQPKRDGYKRKLADIKVSIKKLFLSALLISLGFVTREQGWTMAPMELTWWSLILWFAIGVVIFDLWFYIAHRLLHWPPLYRFHALHHKNVAPTVWSNDCTGSVDTLMEHSFYFAIWFITPSPLEAIFAIRIFNQFIGMIGHAGFELFASPLSKAPFPFVCSTYHDLHHSTFNYNFANIFSIWDRLFGTSHPKYDELVDDRLETLSRGKGD